ncbi:MAG: hypothetical protein HYZ16_07560 [Bacteroidetes bacterium]|nr:hypothetical protein [Bacteroidota bacterium]
MKGGILTLLLSISYLLSFGQAADPVAEGILYINEQFAKYNPYNTSFRIDRNKKTVAWYNDYGEREAPLSAVELRVTEEKHIGVYCLDSNSSCIVQDRGSSSNTSSYDMTFKDSNGDFPASGYLVVAQFELIRRELGVSSYSSGSNSSSSYSSSSSSVDYTKIRENLSYVNSKFATYNEYDTKFEFNTTNGVLTLSDEFGYMKTHISELTFYADYTNNWIEVATESGEQCMIYYSPSGYRQGSHFDSYTMGLRYNDKLISDASTVISKLNEIKAMYAPGTAAYIETGISYVNEVFSIYNAYNTRFAVDQSQKLMAVSDQFGSFKSPSYNTEYRVDVHFGVYCKSGSACLSKYDTYGSRETGSDRTDYTMGLRHNDTLINEAYVVARILNNIAQAITSGSGSGSSYSGSVDINAKLNYINGEFAKYNSYNARWSVNTSAKTITWTNDFGSHTAYLGDVEIKGHSDKNWVGVYCNGGSECIQYVSSSSSSNSTYTEYTMGFADGSSTPASMDSVISAFSEIKSALLGGSRSSTSAPITIDQKISYINGIFASSSTYKNVWTVNQATKQLIGKTASCEVIINLNELTDVTYQESGGKTGIKFYSKSKGIREKCNSYDNYVEYSHEYLYTASDARNVIGEILAIRDLVLR